MHGWLEVKDGRRRDRMQKAFTETLVPCVRINGLPLFAKLELGSLGGFAFFVGFPNGSCPLFCASKFCLWETLIGQKDGEPMRGLEFRKKTEFIGKSKRQIGF